MKKTIFILFSIFCFSLNAQYYSMTYVSVASEDIADFEGDQKFNINTLPIRFGIDFAVVFVYLFSFLLLISSILVYYLYDS